MDIEELKHYKKRIELSISESVMSKISEFQKESGVKVRNLYIIPTFYQTVVDEFPKLSDITVKIELDV